MSLPLSTALETVPLTLPDYGEEQRGRTQYLLPRNRDEIAQTLVETGQITAEQSGATGGNRAVIYRIV